MSKPMKEDKSGEAKKMSSSVPYIGATMDVVTKSSARYLGVLASINVAESTITLTQVRCFGMEEGSSSAQKVGPSGGGVRDYVVFKATGIKQLSVIAAKERVTDANFRAAATPTSSSEPLQDPAIVSQSPSLPPAASSTSRGARKREDGAFESVRYSSRARGGGGQQQFVNDFDFEEANQLFEREAGTDTPGVLGMEELQSVYERGQTHRDEVCYNKSVSFFDKISVSGTRQRRDPIDWQRSVKTNEETFGATALSSTGPAAYVPSSTPVQAYGGGGGGMVFRRGADRPFYYNGYGTPMTGGNAVSVKSLSSSGGGASLRNYSVHQTQQVEMTAESGGEGTTIRPAGKKSVHEKETARVRRRAQAYQKQVVASQQVQPKQAASHVPRIARHPTTR